MRISKKHTHEPMQAQAINQQNIPRNATAGVENDEKQCRRLAVAIQTDHDAQMSYITNADRYQKKTEEVHM